MKELDLYSEAKPRYYQLIPNREDGLILLALYQKYQKQEFTEDQIIRFLLIPRMRAIVFIPLPLWYNLIN